MKECQLILIKDRKEMKSNLIRVNEVIDKSKYYISSKVKELCFERLIKDGERRNKKQQEDVKCKMSENHEFKSEEANQVLKKLILSYADSKTSNKNKNDKNEFISNNSSIKHSKDSKLNFDDFLNRVKRKLEEKNSKIKNELDLKENIEKTLVN